MEYCFQKVKPHFIIQLAHMNMKFLNSSSLSSIDFMSQTSVMRITSDLTESVCGTSCAQSGFDTIRSRRVTTEKRTFMSPYYSSSDLSPISFSISDSFIQSVNDNSFRTNISCHCSLHSSFDI